MAQTDKKIAEHFDYSEDAYYIGRIGVCLERNCKNSVHYKSKEKMGGGYWYSCEEHIDKTLVEYLGAKEASEAMVKHNNKKPSLGENILKSFVAGIHAPEYQFGELISKLLKGHDDILTVRGGNYTANGALYCVEYRGKHYNIKVEAVPIVREAK